MKLITKNERSFVYSKEYKEDDIRTLPLESFKIWDATWNSGQSDEVTGIIVHARNHINLIDIRISLIGYQQNKKFKAQVNKNKKSTSHRIIFEFSPQHLAETTVENPPKNTQVKLRMSGNSRIAFNIPNGVLEKIDLKDGVQPLLDWRELELLVHPRASKTINSDINSQLPIPFSKFSDRNFSFKDAKSAIAETLTAPTEFQTSLEMVGRLLLSPSEDSRWLHTSAGTENWKKDGKIYKFPAWLWHLKLNNTGSKSVRALWSTQFKEKTFPPEPKSEPRTFDDMLSFDPASHWEIIGQTAVYGLPAQRSLDSAVNSNEPPKGNVIKPAEGYLYLEQVESDDAGVAIATPFDNTQISLSALGGVFTAEWKGDPAALLPQNSPDWHGFQLQRLFYQTWLGRDSYVVQVTKGYLYPLGILASEVEVHERRVFNVPKGSSNPTSFLIKRKFIVASSQPRNYPGPYHPYDGRDFPIKQIRMKTLVSPDLNEPKFIEGEAFWPKVEQGGKTIDLTFEWITDDGVIGKCAQIFVPSNDAKKSEVLKALKDHYEKPENDNRRIVTFGGARKIYADIGDANPGTTSFDTDQWILSVRGRIDGSDEFKMDGRMEGANQPPFYPFVVTAFVGIQSIDQLMGTSNGRYKVTYLKDYVENGFNDKHEIYLRLLGATGATLDSSNQTQTTGGFAGQKLNIGAISRKTGLVGGGGGENQLNLSRVSEINIDDALKGDFNPSSFFGEFKLLGLIDLTKILPTKFSSAPQVLQDIGYSANLGIDTIKKINYVIEELEKLFEFFDRAIPGGAELKYGALYPKLVETLKKLNTTLKNLLISGGNSPEKIIACVNSVKQTINEIDHVISDPIPDALKQVILFLQGLVNIISAEKSDYINGLKACATEWAGNAFCKVVVDLNMGAALFGKPLKCGDLKNPAEAFNKIEASLYKGVFGATHKNLIIKILQASGSVKFEHLRDMFIDKSDITKIIRVRLAEAIDKINPSSKLSLKAFDPTDQYDLRHISRIEKFQNDLVVSLLEAILTTIDPIKETQKYIEFIEKALLDWQRNGLEEIFKELKDGLRPIDSSKLDSLHTALTIALCASLQDTLIEPLIDRTKALESQLTYAAEIWKKSALSVLQDILGYSFGVFVNTINIARFANIGKDICGNLNNIVKIITTDMIKVIDANSALITLNSTIENISLNKPSPEIEQLLERAKGDVTRLSNFFIAFLAANPTPPNFDICRDPSDGAGRVTDFINLRLDSIKSINRIVKQVAALEVAIDNPALTQAIAKSCASFLIALLGERTDIESIKTELDSFRGKLDSVQSGCSAAVVLQLDEVSTSIGPMLATFKKPNITISDLLNLTQINSFVDALDQQVTGVLFQAIALTDDEILEKSAIALSTIVTTIKINEIYKFAISLLEKISTLDEGLLSYLFKNQLRNPKTDLKDLANALVKEQIVVEKLQSDDSTAVFSAAKELELIFRENRSALNKLSALKLSINDFGQNITNSIRSELDSLVDELREVAQKFVPTKLQTTYLWATKLPVIPLVEWVGKVTLKDPLMVRLDEMESDPHLILVSQFSFDPRATPPASIKINGALTKFKLRLVGTSLDMATITFQESIFSSINGSAPNFNMKVEKFEIGSALSFLQSLQQLLAPSDSGFYIEPYFDRGPGIEAGYKFAAPLIQLGTIQIINVAFTIAARLPLDNNSSAQFKFKLSSAEQPFLIATPPYGGGGYVSLICDTEKIVAAELSLLFGGVSALQFGPIKGQGRILAGIGFTKFAGGTIITAIFEAVGEGSIACFSISVSIRITLSQASSGPLFGKTSYKFSFKLGWLRVSYSVTAAYTISGKKNSARGLGILSTEMHPPKPNLPYKETQWDEYRKYFNLDILEL